ncbi:MAG: uroporphyrinogen-III synthase [Betaproteobacteria bacterium]|nr:uroporphyrinogen-III synthase [Betaproteobacteria bacterium]
MSGRLIRRVVITRAPDQQQPWRQALEQAGFEVESFPLFETRPMPGWQPDAPALDGLWDSALVVVISPTAAARLAEGVNVAWPRNIPIAVPGPGTRDAVRRAGIDAHIICPVKAEDGYDASALLNAISAALGMGQIRTGRALLVRGETGNDLLVNGLKRLGYEVEVVTAYAYEPVQLTADKQLRLARLLTSGHDTAWLLAQARAVTHLDALARNLRPTGLAGHNAVAIHPRIAAAAQRAGFHRVLTVEPSPSAIVAALESFAQPQ